MCSRRSSGFTLLVLLSVIAIVAILAGLIFPGVRAARVSAHKARTKVQFNQWASAIEGFRSEYGYCEAIVQRVPDPLPGFGRRFVVISFRWLGPEDI